MKFNWLNRFAQGATACLALAIFGFAASLVAPFAPFLPIDSISAILPTASFAFIGLSMLLFQIYILLTVVEIATSSNETPWKFIWGAICLFGGVVGIILYNFIAKKDLKWVN